MAKTLEDLVDLEELDELEDHYGAFQRRHFVLAMDSGSVEFYRRAFRNRRGEVLFALQRPDGSVLLHTKDAYPDGIYRLPGGGIDWGEPVRESLSREVFEETQVTVNDERFLGMLTYQFTGAEPEVPFVSYVFLVPNVQGEASPADESEGITGFRWVPPQGLSDASETLSALEDDAPGRADWGRFRAIGHDFVVEAVS